MNNFSGTVILLFTDIEGSTKLWEKHPDQMREALARHDELLRHAIEHKSGHVFKTVGDAFCAAFSNAGAAVEAAASVQIALQSEPWPQNAPLKVRMALHAGSVEFRDSDYFGQPVNRVARLLATCHGGQVILSEVVRELLLGALPQDFSLKPLGEHRLKDLGSPESIFQLCGPGLRAEFPALLSLGSLPNNLPQQVTSFVGREAEIAEIENLLGKTRLLTLTGSGGCGKTRLSLQVAAQMMDSFPDGVWNVELAPITDPELAVQTVATVLGLKEEPHQSILETLIEHCKTRRLLMILDNCEHLLAACANLADRIIRQCPSVVVLASSREALGVAGELSYRVPSLSMPDPKEMPTPQNLLQYESVRLFSARAQFYQPEFQITESNAQALASICYRLDGIPLAIELAAARCRSMSVDEINKRLDQRFRLLTGGSRTALPRQQTLRSLIDWSYGLLTDQEKALFCRLCVFPGGWSLEAAEEICAGEGIEDYEVMDLLTSLVDKSLVRPEERAGATRYRMLETIRQYARDKMLESGAGETWRDNHLVYYTKLAEESVSELFTTNPQAALDLAEAEHDNFRASIAWSTEREADCDAGLRIALAISRYWQWRGHIEEGRGWLAGTLKDRSVQSKKLRARHLYALSTLDNFHGGDQSERAYAEEALALFREIEDKEGECLSLWALAIKTQGRGDLVDAKEFFEEALAISRSCGFRVQTANNLMHLGNNAIHRGDYPAARSLLEESVAISREIGQPPTLAGALNFLGGCAEDMGDLDTAYSLYSESLSIHQKIGVLHGVCGSLVNLAGIAAARGDLAQAGPLFEEALAISRKIVFRGMVAHILGKQSRMSLLLGDLAAARAQLYESLTVRRDIANKDGIADALEGFAELASATNSPLFAARLWGAAQRLREEIGAPLSPRLAQLYENHYAAAREASGDHKAFEHAWQEGSAMDMDQAVALALAR
jgi:predicted ATPase/class 3 adenylate cyclase